MDIILKESWRC